MPVPPIETILTATGVGSARFGEVYEGSTERMESELGQVTAAVSNSYVPDGDSYIRVEGPPERFDYPSGRSVCFHASLCAYFGGRTDQDLTFVGYRQYTPGPFGTESGVQVGSMLSDHPDDFQLREDPCAAITGTIDGIELKANAQPNESSPNATTALIVALAAGSVPDDVTCPMG
jgi:hypothetical protein